MLLCPQDSPGKNTGLGCHFLLQGIFLTQGWNPSLVYLLYWQAGSLPLVPLMFEGRDDKLNSLIWSRVLPGQNLCGVSPNFFSLLHPLLILSILLW